MKGKNFSQGEKFMSRAIKIVKVNLGEEDEEIANILNSMGKKKFCV